MMYGMNCLFKNYISAPDPNLTKYEELKNYMITVKLIFPVRLGVSL